MDVSGWRLCLGRGCVWEVAVYGNIHEGTLLSYLFSLPCFLLYFFTHSELHISLHEFFYNVKIICQKNYIHFNIVQYCFSLLFIVYCILLCFTGAPVRSQVSRVLLLGDKPGPSQPREISPPHAPVTGGDYGWSETESRGDTGVKRARREVEGGDTEAGSDGPHLTSPPSSDSEQEMVGVGSRTRGGVRGRRGGVSVRGGARGGYGGGHTQSISDRDSEQEEPDRRGGGVRGRGQTRGDVR